MPYNCAKSYIHYTRREGIINRLLHCRLWGMQMFFHIPNFLLPEYDRNN